jgi:hypothetical protein
MSSGGPHPVDAPRFDAYVEGTESRWQAPRRGRQSLDQQRHRRDFVEWKSRFDALRKSHKMRNPDHWLPDESDRPRAPDSRRPALIGLIIVLCLIAGGLALTHILAGMTRLQDCALSGRSNCASQSR